MIFYRHYHFALKQAKVHCLSVFYDFLGLFPVFLCPSVRYRGAMTVAQGKPCTTTRRSDAVLYALLTATGFVAVRSSCIVFVIPPHCHCPFLVLQTEPAFYLQACQSLLENRVLLVLKVYKIH